MSQKHVLEEIRHHEPTIREEVDSLGDGLMDIVNLTSEETGVEGIIFVSTRMASHGPRVKYLQKAGEDQPSFSVSIADDPRVLATSLPERIVARVAPRVVEWVVLNKAALRQIWDGSALPSREFIALVQGLKKLPKR